MPKILKDLDTIRCQWAPTLGALEDTAENIWGIKEYNPETDKELSVIFFGVYGLPDFWKIWRHKGKKWILWAGYDILHLQNGYHLEDGGGIRLDSTPVAEWINKYCESWCENEVERIALQDMGIEAKICPSFLGQVDDYKITYKQNDRPSVYLSANVGREREYGWDIVENIADRCEVDFHLYGSSDWETERSNVIVHGRIPKEQMNEEIKTMQCGLRLNMEIDGFSEITAKSVLWGQYPIVPQSYGYPYLTSFRDLNNLIFQLNKLKYKAEPNPARDYYVRTLNKFPWNLKK